MDDLQYKYSYAEIPAMPMTEVLNLIINGWPSIPLPKGWMSYLC